MNFLTATTAQGGSSSSMIIMLVAMFAIMYFLMIRPQKKRQKEEQAMRDAVEVGDEITTIGGICGKVVTTKEDISDVLKEELEVQRTDWNTTTGETCDYVRRNIIRLEQKLK